MAGVAQLAERLACNQEVAGSIPAAGNIFRLCVFVKIFLTRVYGSAVL